MKDECDRTDRRKSFGLLKAGGIIKRTVSSTLTTAAASASGSTQAATARAVHFQRGAKMRSSQPGRTSLVQTEKIVSGDTPIRSLQF